MGEQEEINIEQEGIKMELYSETLLQNSSILLHVVLENWREGESPCFLGI